MKKKALSLALALVMCLGLSAPAFAAKAGDTTVTAANGNTYTLSNPIIRVTSVPGNIAEQIGEREFEGAYVVPAGTIITNAAGYEIDYICSDGVGTTDKLEVNAGFYYPIWDSPFLVFYGDDESAAPGEVSFTDVSEDSWYYTPVQWAIEQQITSGMGDGTFAPDATCTQAQILTMLWCANGRPEPTIDPDTVDYLELNEDMYYYKAALWAVEKALVSGYFDFNAPCARKDVVLYLWILAGNPSVPDNMPFTDIPAGMALYMAVSWAVTEEITSGISETQFGPDMTCTRAQIVTFLYNALAE